MDQDDYDHNNNRDKCSAFLEQVYEKLYPPLFTHGRRLAGGNVYDAEDLVQETFARFLRYASDPQSIVNPLGYFYRVMQNVLRDKVRKENATKMDSTDDPLTGETVVQSLPALEPVIQRILEDDERWSNFWGNQKLDSREKLLLKLYLDDLKCREIADQLNEDLKAVQHDLNALLTKVRGRVKAKARKAGQ